MTGLYRVMPPIAPDYGGACEVLYELGGLVLIHDASGCTVNYVHFDEPRFGEMPSNVFCSGLTEIEAVMGDDEIVIGKAVKAAEMLKPAFIAFIGSSVPMVVGTDFKGIARLCEDRTGVPCFGFDTNGLRYYTDGASKAMLAVIKRFCEKREAETEEKNDAINLLGLIPMNYGTLAETAKVKALFKNVRSSLGFDTVLSDVRKMAGASKNVVVSAAGLASAEYMKKEYGIPYEVGVPYTREFFEGSEVCDAFALDKKDRILVIGEGVDASSLAGAIGGAASLDMFSKYPGATYRTSDEAEIAEIGQGFDVIIADPGLKELFKQKTFLSRPTVSVSGGIDPNKKF